MLIFWIIHCKSSTVAEITFLRKKLSIDTSLISGERIFLYGMFPVADVILIIHTKQYYGVKVDVRIVVKKS